MSFSALQKQAHGPSDSAPHIWQARGPRRSLPNGQPVGGRPQLMAQVEVQPGPCPLTAWLMVQLESGVLLAEALTEQREVALAESACPREQPSTTRNTEAADGQLLCLP